MPTCLARICLAFLTAAALLGLAATGPAGAAPLIAGGVYSESTSKVCGAPVNCTMLFTGVPPGRVLVVRNLTCSVRHTNGVIPRFFTFAGNGGRGSWVPLGPSYVHDGLRIYTVNLETMVLFGGGQSPTISLTMSAGATQQLYCTITGDYT
jgi:hypothetical protein